MGFEALNKFFLKKKKKFLAFHRREKLKLTVTYWQAWFDGIINAAWKAQSRPMYQRRWRFQEGEHMSGGPEGHPRKKQEKYLSRVWTVRSVMWLHLWRFPRTSLSWTLEMKINFSLAIKNSLLLGLTWGSVRQACGVFGWSRVCLLVGDLGSIPGLGRSPGEGNSNPLQCSYLENPMDRGAWWGVYYVWH